MVGLLIKAKESFFVVRASNASKREDVVAFDDDGSAELTSYDKFRENFDVVQLRLNGIWEVLNGVNVKAVETAPILFTTT